MSPESENDPLLYFEDFRIGQKFSAGPAAPMTEESIITFAKQYDPQDFHTDPVKAKDTFFGELVASGWHTACVSMRMLVEAMPKMKGGLVGRGAEKLTWPRPVYPGDVLRLEVEIVDLRASSKTPERGWMRTKNTTFNQKDEPVLVTETLVVAPRRV